MVEHNPEGLHLITYLALTILAAVLFFYFRQRQEYNRRIQNEYYFASQHMPTTVKSVSFNPQQFQDEPNLPTFSAQEAGQRKMPRQIDHTDINRKNLSTISDFASNISTYEPLSRNKDQLNNTTDKILGDNKKNQSYEPSRLVASPPIVSPKSWKPEQTIESSFRSTAEFLIPQPSDQQGPLNRIVQNIQITKEEPLVAPDSHNMHQEMETENRVLKDLKKKDLDRSGLSLDSPLRMLGSPVTATNGKKKLNTQEDEYQNDSKVDSFSKTEEITTQKIKTQVPHNQRSTQNKLVEKNKKKARRNDFFIDNESDDGMVVEDIKDEYTKNKRPAKDSKDIDTVEKGIISRKYLKNNESEPKTQTNGEKNVSLEESEIERLDKSMTDSSRISNKKRSVADLSYISEHGVSSSMRRYIEKKNMRDEGPKANNFTPSPIPKTMAIEEKPKDPFFAKSQEKTQKETPKTSLFSTQNVLGSSPAQKPNNFLFTTQPKPVTETASSQKSIFANKESEKIQEEKPVKEKSIFDKKNEEEEKAPAKPAQFISLFNQQKPAETQPLIKPTSIFSQPKPAEAEPSDSIFKQNQASIPDQKESPPHEKVESPKQSPPQTQTTEQAKIDLFKPTKTEGSLFANKTEVKSNLFGSKQENAPQKEDMPEEKPKETQPSSGTNLSIFSTAFGNKKPDTEAPKEQEQKTETKPSGGLFGNLTSGLAFNPAKNDLKATKIASEAENAPPSMLKINSSPPGKSTMASLPLFGSSFNNKPKEEAGLGLQRSSSLVAGSPPKLDDTAEKDKEEGNQGGIFNKFLNQKRDSNSLFGGSKPEEKKEPESSPSLGLFSTPSNLFKSSSTEQKTLDFSNKSDPLGNYAKMPEGVGKPGGLFGQKTEQPLVGFTSAPTGNMFSQRDSSKKADDPLASFAKNPVGSPKKADNPLANFSQNPTGNLFGKRAESPKKADKPVIESVQNPTGNLFGQNTDPTKKPEGIFGNLLKSSGEGNKSSIFGNQSAFGSGSQANAASGNTAAPTTGFASLFKNDGKVQGGLFANLGNNNAKNNEEKKVRHREE